MRYLRAFLKFSRPHTIIGTTLSVSGLYLMAFAHTNAGDPQLAALLLAVLLLFPRGLGGRGAAA